MVRLTNVQTAQLQTVTAYRPQVARLAELAEIALPENQDRPYTSFNEGRERQSAGTATEARVNINSVTPTGSTPSTAPTNGASTGSVSVERSESAAKATSPKDEVTFSSKANEALSIEAESTSESTIRAERLAQIRSEIEAGTYDTEARFEAAVERMLNSFE